MFPGGRSRGISKDMAQRTYNVSEESLVRNHHDLREHLT